MNPDDTHQLTAETMNSMIGCSTDRKKLKPGGVHIFGAAWACEADVTKVEISTDAGRPWKPAELGTEHAQHAWRLWSFAWEPSRSDEYTVLSRASDGRGSGQPEPADWSPRGCPYNAVDR